MTRRWVRDTYGVDYRTGEEVVVDGRRGVIVSFPDVYIGVRLDGETKTTRCHPTWHVERTGVRHCTATLPNCDGCGQFTSTPTVVDNSWHGGAGMYMCGELLLCPRCAAKRTPPDPATAGSFHARKD